MAGTLLTIDTETLRRDTSALRMALGRVSAEVDGMFAALAALNRMWDGPANGTFALQFRNDAENMRSLCGTIEKLIGCMEEAAVQYDRHDKQAEAVIDAIRPGG